MKYKYLYKTNGNFSDIIMISDGKYLTGLFFDGNRGSNMLSEEVEERDLPVFKKAEKWLDLYFEGKNPDFTLNYKIENLTPFRKEVLDIVSDIPYGKTITYGEIADEIAEKHNVKKMSAQAVGNAVGFNPISIIMPCHRVVGSDGSITGYGGGLKNKIELLRLEKVIVDNKGYIVKY
jgi:methylated-DNA-[protein]-cysteine S-methyltransferase